MAPESRPRLQMASHSTGIAPGDLSSKAEGPTGVPTLAPAATTMPTTHTSVRSMNPSFGELVVPSSWKSVTDEPDFNRTKGVVRGAVAYEKRVAEEVKAQILPTLTVTTVSPGDLSAAEEHITGGGVAFCDASIVRSTTEAASKTRCVVTLINYSDPPVQRIREWHDPRDEIIFDPLTELDKLLAIRRNSGMTTSSGSELRDRQVMAFMERVTGLDREEGELILHGRILPVELLAQGDDPDVVAESVHLAWKILDDPRILSVVSQTARGDLLTIGMALEPYQYVFLDDYKGFFRNIVGSRYESAKWREVGKGLSRLAATAGPDLLVGVLRTETTAPPRVFHVHRQRRHQSAVVAMAACAMEPLRCFPEGTDICDQLSGSYCRQRDVDQEMAVAHLEAGAPFSYLKERSTRHQVKGEL